MASLPASRTIRARSSSSRQSVDSRIAVSLPQTLVSAGAQGCRPSRSEPIVPERPAGVADAPTAERVVVLCAAEGPLWEGGSTGRPV